MRSLSWALALFSFLFGFFGRGVLDHQVAPAPASGVAMNRELERRLDLAVNGSTAIREARPPVASTVEFPGPSPGLPPSSGAAAALTVLLGVMLPWGAVAAFRQALGHSRRRNGPSA